MQSHGHCRVIGWGSGILIPCAMLSVWTFSQSCLFCQVITHDHRGKLLRTEWKDALSIKGVEYQMQTLLLKFKQHSRQPVERIWEADLLWETRIIITHIHETSAMRHWMADVCLAWSLSVSSLNAYTELRRRHCIPAGRYLLHYETAIATFDIYHRFCLWITEFPFHFVGFG